MDDKLKQLYELYSRNGLIKTTDYNTFSSANENQRKQLYDLGKKNGLFKSTDYNTFSTAFSPAKKKSSTELPSQSQKRVATSATVKTTTQKPSVSSGGKKIDIFTGLPGKEDNQYRVINNQWQRKEPNKDWTTVRDANAILYLNKHYKKNITPNEGFEGISSKLIDNGEEAVTSYLKRNYGHLGFNFEKSGVGDRVTVFTEDGKNSETFYLDNWTDGEDASEAIRMKGWLKENIKTSDRERYNKIDNQISEIKNAKPKEKVDLTKDAFANQSAGLPADLSLDIKQQLKLKDLEKGAMEYNRSRMNTLVKDINESKKTSGKYDDELTRSRVAAIYGNKDEIAKQNRYISNNLEDIARANKYVSNKVYQYEQEKTKLDEEIAANGGILSPEMEEKQRSLDGMSELIKAQSEDLKTSIKTAKKDQNKINEIAGEYMLFKESKGTVGGGIVNNFLKGATNLARFAGLSRQGQEELIKLIGSDYTENEYTTSNERSDIEKVLFSLSNSIGAAVGGGGVATAPSFFAQSYYELKDQIDDDPNFDSVPELEKTLLASAYGLTIGALEKYGLDVITSKTPLGKTMSGTVNKILASTIKGLPKGASAEILEDAINKNIKTLIAKGAINVAGGSLVEGSTEFAQELAGGGIKELYNTMKDKEMFKSPESLLSQAYEAAWLGALGGAVMQTPVQAVNSIATGLANKNTTMAEILEKAVTDSELRSMMTTSIKSKIVAGEITSEEGKKQLEAVNQAAGAFQKMPDNLTQEDKSVSFDLMIERSKIEKEIEGKDENLVAAQKSRITEINNQLKTISENAVQKQAAGEVPVQPEAAVSGEMAQGKPQAEPQVATKEGQEKESVTQIFAAPLYSTTINTIEDAKSIRESGTHEQTVKAIDSISSVFGIPIEKMENSIGGYTMDDTGDSIVEISYAIKTKPVKNLQEIEGITAVMGALMPQVQESTIAAREVDESDTGFTGDNGVIRYDIKVDNIQGALDSLKAAGINDFSINENTGIVSLLDFSKGLSNETIEKINIFDKELKNRNVKYSEPRKQALESVLIDRDRRKVIISDLIRNTIQQGQQGSDYYNALIEAAKRDAEFKNETVDVYLGKELYDEIQQETRVKPGNRLFNEPLKEVREIANRYYERVFGSKRPIFEGTAELDVERAKRIASAFEQMKHDPKNPEVKKAYEALSKETIDQYKDFLDAGYVVEINNEEPYGNSQEMIDDLKNNKRIKIFSTEAGFGDMPITDQQRSDNPLLATTEFTDVNGQPMLVNDIFRAIHDFYGHAELGNSFGPKGEENAWNVHARMFSPLARKAMTTETRGQNSWVNFSGFNDEIQKLRDKAASLRDSGKIEEAQQVVDEIYEKFRFADQKIGLLPDEFSNIEEDTFEDIKGLDTKEEANLKKVLNALDKIEKDLDQFGKETLGVNIPVALAKTIVKAVKALVKTGITLEQAIKQIAAEYNLSDRDVKSLVTPTKVSNINVNEVRSKDRPGKRISKGISVKTVGGNKVIEETEDLSLEYVKKNAPKVFISNANIISKYPLIAGKKKFETATTIEEAQKIYDVFVREVANNLNYLMDEFKPEFREISTLWYDGANAIANDFADQFGVSAEQAAGIIAAMSPQKDWYQNVRLAEMVLMAYKDNPVMTKEMIDYQKGVNEKGLYEGAVSPGKKLNNAEKEYKRSKTKANKEALDEAKDKLNKAIEKANSVISMLEQYIGKKLNDVPAFVQPYMVRTYHEVNTTKDYNIVAPDGSVQGVARKNDGTKAKVAWGSYSEIGKAVAIYNDGSQENITKSLGEMHKIRNFYNNIIDPMSKDGDVTMDTHAIAAALLLPLSGNSVQVGQNFGTGTSNSAPFGIKGLYYAYADAYALSAKENNLLPRQVQSITWEAIRGLYTDTFKSNKTQVANINNIWKEYQDGKITIDEARKQAKDAAGGIKDPTWARPIQDELGEISKEESISGRGKGDGRNIVGRSEGGDVLTADTKDKKILKKALDFLDKADKDLDKFGRETLGINIPVATMRAIIKLAKTLVKTGITLQDAIIQAAEQKNVSKKDALNAIKFMSETINRPVKKVIVNEMAALRDQLKFEARAARQSQQDLKKRQRELIVTVNKMKRSGTVTAAQAASLAKKITYLNVYNPVMVDRFLQYAERLFKNAEYQNILSEASKVRKSIKNFMKTNQANVVAMAKDFGKINPAMVEDIEQYLENAKAVLNAVRRSKKDTDFPIKNAADIDVITKYTEDMLEKQEEQLKNEKLKEYQDLVDQGILSGDMTLKDINEVIKAIEEEGPNNRAKQETELRRFLNTRFEMYSTIVKSILKTNVDPFTGDTVEISDKDKEVLKRLLKVNLDDMSVKNAYTIVESMDNFIVNGITDGLDGAISAYEGDIEAKNLVKEGMKADKIRGLLFGLSPVTGRAIYENFATLPVLFDSLFKGVKSGMKVMDSMGFNLLSRGFAKATKIYNNAINDYGDKFSKSKPNDQEFNTSFNAYERGMLAYLKRTVLGNETAQKAEFKRRVELIKESIQSLREYGNEDQQKMANIYEEVYTKLGLDNADITIDQVQANVDPKNAEAVNWWIDQWSQHYSDLYDVSLDVYNTKLGKDINYTTDRLSRVDGERELVDEATGNIGAFALDLGLTSYKDKAGVLMESNKNFKSLDTGKKSSTRFVNLDFDVSNASALRSALIDVNTASAVRRVDAFLNSRSYDKLFAEEKDAKILKRRVQNYILRYKNKVAFSDPTLGELDKYMDMVASIGATRALGGPSQAVLQTVPVFLSTLANAGVSNMDFKGLVSDTDFHTWLNNSGYAIANRGMETSTAIESANKYLDKVAETKGEKLFKGVMKLNEFWLKTFLSMPDVWIARNSWKTYYTQSLKEQGIYNGDIDWTTHEINEKAADYAQHMVDRQQNVSDAAMMGDFMNSQQPIKKIVRKVVLPFANFIMNQKTRLYSDIRTLSSETHTKGDKRKAWLSIGGLMTEIAAYNAISYALKLYVYDTIAAALTDYEEDEEEKKKNKQNRMKFVAQNLVKDIFSPLPIADGITIQGLNFVADFFQEKTMSQDEINKAVEERNIYLESRGKEKMTAKEKEKFVKEFVDSQKMVFEEYETKKWIDLGTATIAIEKARELYKMIDMSATGKFKKEFKGNEVDKVILPDNMGDMKTATTLSALYNLGLLPREFNSVATSMKKYIEKNAISEDQLEDYKAIKKEFGDVDGYKKGLLKSKMKIDNVMNEIRWVEENGGLTKEQSAEYNKLREVQGNVYIDDLKKLQKGIKAEKIYKRGK